MTLALLLTSLTILCFVFIFLVPRPVFVLFTWPYVARFNGKIYPCNPEHILWAKENILFKMIKFMSLYISGKVFCRIPKDLRGYSLSAK